MDKSTFTQHFEELRPALRAYLTRMTLRTAIADELVQTTALRALAAPERAPAAVGELRPWLFKIATRLALDHRRKAGRARETLLADSRVAGESDEAFVSASAALRGQPEVAGIAKEHLVVCFACTAAQLSPEMAAALWLVDVYDLSLAEAADALEARGTQVKNWLQAARAHMRKRYAATCALIGKQGACHQCVELDGFFEARRGAPLARADKSFESRLRVLRELRDRAHGPWHRLLEAVLAGLR